MRRTVAARPRHDRVEHRRRPRLLVALHSATRRMHTAFVQVASRQGHDTGSYEYMALLKERLDEELPELARVFLSRAAWWTRC